jgi:general secretion pathway protein L
MRNTLLLRKDPGNESVWRWLQLDDKGRPQGSIHAGALSDAASEASGQRVVVLVSGADCLLTRVSIPGGSRQKLLRAVPYALEEQISEEVENLHFAVGSTQVDDAWPVAVINKQFMDELTEDFSEAGLDVQQVTPEVLALPYSDDETSVLVENDVALVRTDSTTGFAVDSDNLGILLAAQMTDDESALSPLRLFVREDSLRADMMELVGETRVEPFNGDAINVFARGLDTRSINLLQGDYSRSGDWAALLRPWRATAALFVAGILVSNVVMGIDYFRLSKESEQLRAQIEQTFKEALPETRRIVTPRIQMQQQLDKLQRQQGAGGGFLSLLGQSGSVLRGKEGVEVSAATFRAGRLDVELTVSNLQLLDQLKQALMESGRLSVEIQSATTGKDQRVQSRLRIEGVGS